MEATIVLVVFLTLLVGGMMLALVMGYRSIEEERAQQELQRRVEAAARAAEAMALPAFFARTTGRMSSTPAILFDDALLAQLERHVRAEQAMVTQFVHFPSVESLYSKSGSSLHAH